MIEDEPLLETGEEYRKLVVDYKSLISNPIYTSIRVYLRSKYERLGSILDKGDMSDKETNIIIGERRLIQEFLSLHFQTYNSMRAEIELKMRQEIFEEIGNDSSDQDDGYF